MDTLQYYNAHDDYCFVCLHSSSETSLVPHPANMTELFTGLVMNILTPWLCCNCADVLRTYHELRGRTQRAQALLSTVLLHPQDIEANKDYFIAELNLIKYNALKPQITKVTTNENDSEQNEESIKYEVDIEYDNTLSEIISNEIDVKPTSAPVVGLNGVKFENEEVDINTAIDDLDNEGYIVSEEVHQHVETINLSVAGDRQRALRMRKPAYVDAVLRCEVCALGYQTQEDYDAHMHNHSPLAGSHCCHPCKMYFEKHRELEKHVQSHYRRHRCRICSHGSIDYRAAVKHYSSQHSRKFTCWHCNKEFRRPINLKKHMQKLHKKEKTDGCAVCGEEFSDADQLQLHMQSHKPHEISWHECPICKKKSRHKYNMEQHIKAHEKESMPIVCDICHKTFKTQVLLTTHIQRLHTENSKKFQCDECSKFFYDKGELRIHVQWTHKREGGVQCSQCVRKFRTAYLLNDHFRRVHENIPKPKDKLCDLCGRGFSSRKSLKCHRYIHTGERPHACPDCGQTFRQRGAMRLHYKSKHLHMRWKQLTKQKKPDHVSL